MLDLVTTLSQYALTLINYSYNLISKKVTFKYWEVRTST